MTTAIAATSPYPSTLVAASGGAVRARGGQTVATGFDAALAQAQKPSAPLSLLPEKQASDVKIARSYKMESAAETAQAEEADGYSFGDFIDLINPLQHIPVVGSIYRALTGDEVRPDVKVAGGFLLGAATGGILLGAAAAIANTAFEESNGKEPMIELADNLFGGGHAGPENLEEKTIQVAQAQTREIQPPAPQAAPAVPVRLETVELTPLTRAAPSSSVAEAAVSAAAQPAAPAAATTAPAATVAASVPAAPPMRVGNTLYTSPQMKAAARATAQPAATLEAAPTAKSQLDSQTLGALIHQQAQTREQGNALPPELVQDMMLMALDKYKAAQADLP